MTLRRPRPRISSSSAGSSASEAGGWPFTSASCKSRMAPGRSAAAQPLHDARRGDVGRAVARAQRMATEQESGPARPCGHARGEHRRGRPEKARPGAGGLLDGARGAVQLPGDARGRPEPEMPGVSERVVGELVALLDDASGELRVPRRALADDEEGGALAGGGQGLEHPRGHLGVGPVVEGESEAVARGVDADERSGQQPRALPHGSDRDADQQAEQNDRRQAERGRQRPAERHAGDGGQAGEPEGGEDRAPAGERTPRPWSDARLRCWPGGAGHGREGPVGIIMQLRPNRYGNKE